MSDIPSSHSSRSSSPTSPSTPPSPPSPTSTSVPEPRHSFSSALPEDLRRHLKLELEKQNVGSVYVPYEVVWAIGIGGALVSAAVTLSPWTCYVRHWKDRQPYDSPAVVRERSASLPTSTHSRSNSPSRPTPRRKSSLPLSSSSSSTTGARSGSPSPSGTSSDSGVSGLQSILHATSVSVGGRKKPLRHVSFNLGEGDRDGSSEKTEAGKGKGPVGEESWAGEQKEKRDWCPFVLRRKVSPSRQKPTRSPPMSPTR